MLCLKGQPVQPAALCNHLCLTSPPLIPPGARPRGRGAGGSGQRRPWAGHVRGLQQQWRRLAAGAGHAPAGEHRLPCCAVQALCLAETADPCCRSQLLAAIDIPRSVRPRSCSSNFVSPDPARLFASHSTSTDVPAGAAAPQARLHEAGHAADVHAAAGRGGSAAPVCGLPSRPTGGGRLMLTG